MAKRGFLRSLGSRRRTYEVDLVDFLSLSNDDLKSSISPGSGEHTRILDVRSSLENGLSIRLSTSYGPNKIVILLAVLTPGYRVTHNLPRAYISIDYKYNLSKVMGYSASPGTDGYEGAFSLALPEGTYIQPFANGLFTSNELLSILLAGGPAVLDETSKSFYWMVSEVLYRIMEVYHKPQ